MTNIHPSIAKQGWKSLTVREQETLLIEFYFHMLRTEKDGYDKAVILAKRETYGV
jgi:hypothetical protein